MASGVQWKRLTRDLLNGKASKAEWAITMAVAHNPSEKPRGRRRLAALAGLAEHTAESGIREAEANGRIELIPFEHEKPAERGQASYLIRLTAKYQTGVEIAPVGTGETESDDAETGAEITPVLITGVEIAPVSQEGSNQSGAEIAPVIIGTGVEIAPVDSTPGAGTAGATRDAVSPSLLSSGKEDSRGNGRREKTLPSGAGESDKSLFALAPSDVAEKPARRGKRAAEAKPQLAACAVYADVFRVNPLTEYAEQFQAEYDRMGEDAFRRTLVECKGRAFNPRNNVNVLEALRNGFRAPFAARASPAPKAKAEASGLSFLDEPEFRGRLVN
jgi:hypothetical protein